MRILPIIVIQDCNVLVDVGVQGVVVAVLVEVVEVVVLVVGRVTAVVAHVLAVVCGNTHAIYKLWKIIIRHH